MKKIIFTISLGLAVIAVNGQQKQGKVLYTRTTQIMMDILTSSEPEQQLLPRTHTSKLEVLFGNDQCLRRSVEEDRPEVEEGGGMRIVTMEAGTDDLTYVNLMTGQVVAQREFGAKNYIVADSVHKLNWKLTGKTTTILNYPCQQAVAQLIGKRSSMRLENGEMKMKDEADTSEIVAWFTLSVPVSAGPEHPGQLPGLILGMDIKNGRIVYKAEEISEKVELTAIKPPSKGKKVTEKEFEGERDKIFAEMQRNNGGRVRRMEFDH
ncbi:GLPGLI family protein [Chitinophaga ginsengisoli]|uniref:GLPGLI family protein n=1 Tax=Chitinophaga ginsengisoli TaxID=363837 RepID=A0A2P8FVQ7_9BACT|nr:GLPGLI family protein [Chitinophaga ginsengisoli]PSL25818.1 GLPGLI family protein [Chitinophaga ginsengisoli]